MHTVSVLHKLLARSVPIHAIRLNAAIAAVQALTHGAKATVTSPGRHLAGSTFDKHKIKRMDRLLSNRHLDQERNAIRRRLSRLQSNALRIGVISEQADE